MNATWHQASGPTCAVIALFAAAPLQAHIHEPCEQTDPQPLLSVGDFDASGVVDQEDVTIIARQLGEGYVAFFDRNADGELNGRDVSLVAREQGRSSTVLDQEIAEVYWATERYRDIDVAIAEGFIPYTEGFIGHGEHWGNPYDGRLDGTFEHDVPEGLNYSKEGELMAVFYFKRVFTEDGPVFGDFPPEGFTGEEDIWHTHVGACYCGVNPFSPAYDADDVQYEECTTMEQCLGPDSVCPDDKSALIWNPKFYMVHLWLYELNPCGNFGAHSPAIQSGRNPADAMTRCSPDGGHGDHGG